MRPIVGAAVLALASTGAVCAGCHKGPPAGSDAGQGGPGPTTDQAAQVLARVGDRTIRVGDYVAALEHMDQFDRFRFQAPERRKELLAEMIDVMLLADEARAKGYDKDPVAQQEIREILRDAMLAKAREGAPGPDEVPAAEVSAYFDAHRADFRDPERRRFSAIVLPAEAAADPVLEAAKKATPAQWGELLRAKSVDAQARSDGPVDLAGDMGFVSPPGDARGVNTRVPDVVRAAVFDIAVVGGVLPRAVKAGDKLWIVKLTTRTEAHDRTLQDAERSVRVKLAAEKMRAREQAFLDELRQQYPVKVDEAALAQVKVETPARDAGAM